MSETTAGEDGTLASWRIVRLIGLIAVITAVFSFTFSQVYEGQRLAYILYSLYALSVVSAIFAFVLGAVRYMEEQDRQEQQRAPYDDALIHSSDRSAAGSPSPAGDDEPAAANGGATADTTTDDDPIPVVLEFDEEVGVLEEHFGDDAPKAWRTFTDDYDRLKSAGRLNRDTIASDLKATMNPILTELERDDDAEDALAAAETVDEALFTYVGREPSELLVIESADLFLDGQRVPVTRAQERTVRVKVRVRNEGDGKDAKVRLQFLGSDGVRLTDSYLSLGPIGEGQVKELNTSVYVPSIAYSYDVQAVEASEQEEFYQM